MGEMDIKQRLTYIDIARAIGILFVVLGHVNQFYRDSQGIENSQTLIFIYAFHMPLFFILSGTLTYVIAMLNEQIDFWCSRVGNPILCLIGGLIGAYWVIGLSKNIKSKLLVFIGQNTMTMMGTHMIMFRIVWNLCSIKFFNIIPLLTANVYGEILIFILIIAANLPIMYVYDRYLPFLIGKRK